MPYRKPENTTTKNKPVRLRATTLEKAARVQNYTDEGLTAKEIGGLMGITPRQVFALRKIAKERVIVAPKDRAALDKQVKMTLLPTVAGFKAFYERYSDMPLPKHAEQWVDAALHNPLTLINTPPGHAKSTILSVWLPIWLICRDRDIQILIISQTIRLAVKFVSEIAIRLETNRKLIEDFGGFRPSTDAAVSSWRPGSAEILVDGRRRLVLPGDLTIQGRGAEQQVLGFGAEWIIVDDPVNPEAARSETEREKLSDWFHGSIMTRLRSPSSAPQHVVVVGQRVNVSDLYGDLAQEKRRASGEGLLWHHITQPAVLHFPDDDDPKPKVLWPEFWPYERLMEQKDYVTDSKRGDEAVWETMYQQNPWAAGLLLVEKRWIFEDNPGCLDHDRDLGEGIDPQERKCRVFSLDPSPTNFAALLVADVHLGPRFKVSLVDIVRKRMGTREMIQELDRLQLAYGPIHRLLLESNSAHFFKSSSDFQRWQERSGIPMLTHTTARNKQDPQWGIRTLSTEFEYGNVRIPWGDAAARDAFDIFVHEAMTYQVNTLKGGETDDTMMALWFLKYNWLRLPAVSPTVGKDRLMQNAGPGFEIPKELEAGYAWAR